MVDRNSADADLCAFSPEYIPELPAYARIGQFIIPAVVFLNVGTGCVIIGDNELLIGCAACVDVRYSVDLITLNIEYAYYSLIKRISIVKNYSLFFPESRRPITPLFFGHELPFRFFSYDHF